MYMKKQAGNDIPVDSLYENTARNESEDQEANYPF